MSDFMRKKKLFLHSFVDDFFRSYPEVDILFCSRSCQKLFERVLVWSKIALSAKQESFLMNAFHRKMSVFFKEPPLFFFENLKDSDKKKIKQLQGALWDISQIQHVYQLWTELRFPYFLSHYAMNFQPYLSFSKDHRALSCNSPKKNITY